MPRYTYKTTVRTCTDGISRAKAYLTHLTVVRDAKKQNKQKKRGWGNSIGTLARKVKDYREECTASNRCCWRAGNDRTRES